jgi:hypothetical protein
MFLYHILGKVENSRLDDSLTFRELQLLTRAQLDLIYERQRRGIPADAASLRRLVRIAQAMYRIGSLVRAGAITATRKPMVNE